MERVTDMMTKDPACCTPETSLQEVAALMIKFDCGEIPVVDSLTERRIAGVITDRDICCRTVAKGLNPLNMKTSDVMTFPAITVNLEATLDLCCDIMEREKIRRLPVVDDYEKVCGIISLGDIARKKDAHIVDILRDISQPKGTS